MKLVRPDLIETRALCVSALSVFLVCCSSPTDESSPDSGGSRTPSSLFGEAGGGGGTVTLNDLDGGAEVLPDGAEPEPEPGDGGSGTSDARAPDGSVFSDAGEPLEDAALPTWVRGPCEPCTPGDPSACDPGLVCQTFQTDTTARCWVPCEQCAPGETYPCGKMAACEEAYGGVGHFVCFGPQKICTPYDGVSNYSDIPANCESFLGP